MIYMQKRKERLLDGAESLVRSLVPQAFDNPDDDGIPYDIRHTINGEHVVIDVHVSDAKTSGQLIGKGGATVKTMRRLLETIANQEGLRVTFDIVPPTKSPRRRPRA